MLETSNKPIIRVLLVEDDQIDRMACKRALAQHQDYEFIVFEAETGIQGLKLLREERIDCVLLDFNLPDLTGVEFLSELAEASGELPMPVVMLTGSDNAMVAVDAMKLGARDYVVKGSDSGSDAMQWLPAVVMRALREQQAILDKTEALTQLREAEAKYRCLVEQMPAITYIASLETPGKLLYVSPQIRQLGFAPETWLEGTEGILKQIHPEDRETVIEAYAATYEHHTPLRCEYRLITQNGRARWFLDEANVVSDESRGALCLQGLLVDITLDKENAQELYYYRRRLEELVAQRTAQLEKQSRILESANARMDHELCERKRAEATLRRSEARFRLLLESAGEGIIGVNGKGLCTFINPTALTMLGYEQAEMLDREVCATIHPSLVATDEQCCTYQAFHNGVARSGSDTFHRKDGSIFPAVYSAYPMQVDGKVVGAVLIIRATTEA